MAETDNYEICLYDSETGESLHALKVVDISHLQSEWFGMILAYTQAKRGRIVQLHRTSGPECLGARIHYFIDEPGGMDMIREDEARFGFQPGVLVRAVQENAPAKI